MEHMIKFTKMHGAGNDYIYINTLLYDIPNPSKAAIKWSTPHTGIGSDGIVLIGEPKDKEIADYKMRIFNADGSEALMCGNASRCIGKYLYEKGLTKHSVIRLETLSGIKTLLLDIASDNTVKSVTVDMLEPKFQVTEQYIPTEHHRIVADDREFDGTFVSMGNPHFVCFVNDVKDLDIAKYGSIMENNPAFPQRCNIEFAEIKDDHSIRTRVWERGSGITMACGTGACATSVAATLTKNMDRSNKIVMDGGTLNIEWRAADNHIFMTGPAAFVFEGEIVYDIDNE